MTDLLLIGTGPHAIQYAEVLKSIGLSFDIVGRGLESRLNFALSTGLSVSALSLPQYLSEGPRITDAIVSVSCDQLSNVCTELILNGFKRILLEKPGALSYSEIRNLAKLAKAHEANVWIAYNRRFYSSVIHAHNMLRDDGGVKSLTFDFTEWSHTIEPMNLAVLTKNRWFLSNSSHVADLAFYLGGRPVSLDTNVSGSLPWHPSSSIFSGSGITEDRVSFSYHANWDAPGRWGLQVFSKNYKFIFQPLEGLFLNKLGTTEIIEVELDDYLDRTFKPGLYLQVLHFLKNQMSLHCSIDYHESMYPHYLRIAGYD